MISTSEARELVLKHSTPLETHRLFCDESLNKSIQEDIFALRDQPPFDRIMMDGIAINYQDIEQGVTEFPILGFQSAGIAPLSLKPKTCLEVATGAILPLNADCIVPYEQIEIKDAFASILNQQTIKRNEFIHFSGSDYKAGSLIIEKNSILDANSIALILSQGTRKIKVTRTPKIALISTGDELVEAGSVNIERHQIFRSNVYALKSLLETNYFYDVSLFHLNDNLEDIKDKTEALLKEFDVIIFSGGVSKGKKDFLPLAFDELGIERIFHRVSQKPGKPLWFGKKDSTLVFGLPGNPVSGQVALKYYVLTALKKMSYQDDSTTGQQVKLSSEIRLSGAMTHFIPVKLEMRQNEVFVRPVIINTSGDFFSLRETSGFVVLDNSQSQNIFLQDSFQTYLSWGSILG